MSAATDDLQRRIDDLTAQVSAADQDAWDTYQQALQQQEQDNPWGIYFGGFGAPVFDDSHAQELQQQLDQLYQELAELQASEANEANQVTEPFSPLPDPAPDPRADSGDAAGVDEEPISPEPDPFAGPPAPTPPEEQIVVLPAFPVAESRPPEPPPAPPPAPSPEPVVPPIDVSPPEPIQLAPVTAADDWQHIYSDGEWSAMGEWSPDPGAVPQGLPFTQMRPIQRQITDYWENQTTGAIAQDNSHVENSSQAQSAVGTLVQAPVQETAAIMLSPVTAVDDWEHVYSEGAWIPIADWTPDPDLIPQGTPFTQTRQTQRQIQDYWINHATSEVRENNSRTEFSSDSRAATGRLIVLAPVQATDDWEHIYSESAWNPISDWSPDADTVAAGTLFTQTRRTQRQIQDYWINHATGEIRDNNSRTEISTETQSANGQLVSLAPFNVSETPLPPLPTIDLPPIDIVPPEIALPDLTPPPVTAPPFQQPPSPPASIPPGGGPSAPPATTRTPPPVIIPTQKPPPPIVIKTIPPPLVIVRALGDNSPPGGSSWLWLLILAAIVASQQDDENN